MKRLQQIIFCTVIALSLVGCNDTKKKEEVAKPAEKACPPCEAKAADAKGGADPGKTTTNGAKQPDVTQKEPDKKEPEKEPKEPPKQEPTATSAPTLASACTMVKQTWSFELKTEESKAILEVEFAFNDGESLAATDTLQRLFKDESKKPMLVLELVDPKAPNQEGYHGQWKISQVKFLERAEEHPSTFDSYQKEVTKADQSKDKLAYNDSGPKLFFTSAPKPLLFISVPMKLVGEKDLSYCVLVNAFAADNDKFTITPIGQTVLPKEPPVPSKLEDIDPAILKILAPLLKP